MKLLALLTPAAMLGVLWALQRLERWMVRPEATRAHRHPARAAGARHPPAAAAVRGGEPVVAEVGDDALLDPGVGPGTETGPLLRDPPPPPGYVDPLEESDLLDDPSAAVRTG